MQLAALVPRVVHAADAQAQLEAQRRVVAQEARRLQQVGAVDVEGELAAVDDGLLDHVDRIQALLLQSALQLVGHLVEPTAVRAVARAGQHHRDGQAAESGGVAAALRAEHALAAAHHLHGDLAHRLLAAGLGYLVVHRSCPRISLIGVAFRARASPNSSARRLFTPSGSCWILSCSFRMASISISGRGGQPGR